MDDRTWTATTAEAAVDPVGVWRELSGRILLKENPTKIQLMARSKKDKDRLREEAKRQEEGLEEYVKDSVELLGMETVGARGRKKQHQRKEKIG